MNNKELTHFFKTTFSTCGSNGEGAWVDGGGGDLLGGRTGDSCGIILGKTNA